MELMTFFYDSRIKLYWTFLMTWWIYPLVSVYKKTMERSTMEKIGKSTISTGPFSMSQTVTNDQRVHNFPGKHVFFPGPGKSLRNTVPQNRFRIWRSKKTRCGFFQHEPRKLAIWTIDPQFQLTVIF